MEMICDTVESEMTAEVISRLFVQHLAKTVARPLESSTAVEQYHALAHTVRDLLMERWLATVESYKQHDVRVVSYLSAEYLPGRIC